ncbi:hypothetical protein BVY01_02045, partial [bacterium I07]
MKKLFYLLILPFILGGTCNTTTTEPEKEPLPGLKGEIIAIHVNQSSSFGEIEITHTLKNIGIQDIKSYNICLTAEIFNVYRVSGTDPLYKYMSATETIILERPL